MLSGREEKDIQAVNKLKESYHDICDQLGKVIIGQNDIIEELLTAMFSRGHCLLVGVPGLAKTLLIKTLSRILDLKFSRIQFTPDLMPADITGTDIIEEDKSSGKRNFKFIKGPIFSNIILADEINRTPPKTQAALLQSMQEYEVTAGGTTYPLDLPFFVLATQNPIEQEGTYPLPEAQLDRFMFNIHIAYPGLEEEINIVKETTSFHVPQVSKLLNAGEILELQDIVRRIPIPDHVTRYAVTLVNMTRPNSEVAPDYINDWVTWGAGPRASQYLIIGAKARAVLHGRYSAGCEDIDAVARPVLRHRIVTNFNAEADGISSLDIIEKLLHDIQKL
jgi:MoxR-like ATPase